MTNFAPLHPCRLCDGSRMDPGGEFIPATHLEPAQAEPCPVCLGTGVDVCWALDTLQEAELKIQKLESLIHAVLDLADDYGDGVSPECSAFAYNVRRLIEGTEP